MALACMDLMYDDACTMVRNALGGTVKNIVRECIGCSIVWIRRKNWIKEGHLSGDRKSDDGA